MLHTTFDGLRVLDLSSNLAGPLAAMVFGDLGADVIKVEHPGTGDDSRGLPPSWQGDGTVFLSVNRNKRSIVLDLRSDEGRDAMLRLAEHADIVIESFGPGGAEKLGLGFEDLRHRNPRVIYASVSAFGTGPLGRDLPGYDSLIQGLSGMMSLTGEADGPPVRVAPSTIDLSSGLWLVIATLLALRRRDDGGGAQYVDVALLDSAYQLMCHQILSMLVTGEVPRRLGTASGSTMPNGAFRARDGWIVVATANDRQFRRLCDVLGAPELADDQRFATLPRRVANRDALDDILNERFAVRPVEEWRSRLRLARVAAGPLVDLAEAIGHPLSAERTTLVPPESAGDYGGPPLVRTPLDTSGECVRRPPPRLGEHTEEILREAGFDDPSIAALTQRTSTSRVRETEAATANLGAARGEEQ